MLAHDPAEHRFQLSPEQYRAEQEQAEYLRACHGGLPDAPDALDQGAAPSKNLKG